MNIAYRLRLLDLAVGNDDDKVRAEAERAELFRKKTLIAMTRTGLIGLSVPDKWTTKLEKAEAALPIVEAAWTRLEYLLNAQPDGSDRPDHPQCLTTMGLIASMRALEKGVEYFNGVPTVPEPLRSLLGVIQLPTGQVWPNWFGSLTEIKKTIADLTPRVEKRRADLAAHLATAEQLLAETPE